MLNALIVGDPHLTLNPRDAYRWRLFDSFLPSLSKKLDADHLIILGDLTDKKDKHSAHFVERLCSCFNRLANIFEVHIIKGNHDYADPEVPFFSFLNMFQSRIHFYKKPVFWAEKGVLFLPHSNEPEKEWRRFSGEVVDYIFMHQTVLGSITSSGYTLKNGLAREFFDVHKRAEIYSGDIHLPQYCGPVRYIGTPYPINFNDHYENCIVHLDGGEPKDISTTHIMRRRMFHLKYIRELIDTRLKRGAQVKVSLELPAHEISDWRYYRDQIKKICEERGWELHGRTLVPKVTKAKKTRFSKVKGASAVGNDPVIQFDHYCEVKGLKGSDVHGEGKMLVLEDYKDDT